MKGIDVSVHEKVIDWEKVKKSGIEFAMIKASQGGSTKSDIISPFTDSYFKKNIENAYANGIKCGAYHYMTGNSSEDAEAEADWFLEQVSPYKSRLRFPCALDFEDARYKSNTAIHNTLLVKTFLRAVERAGFIPMLYTNRSFLNCYLNKAELDEYDIWFALYKNLRTNYPVPDQVNNLTIWQWDDAASVDGINKKVDINEGYFDYSKKEREFIPGDVVMLKPNTKLYYKNGPSIPNHVKDYLHVVAAVDYHGKRVRKSGDECVLLGKKVNPKTKNITDGINTWVAKENIMFY